MSGFHHHINETERFDDSVPKIVQDKLLNVFRFFPILKHFSKFSCQLYTDTSIEMHNVDFNFNLKIFSYLIGEKKKQKNYAVINHPDSENSKKRENFN